MLGASDLLSTLQHSSSTSSGIRFGTMTGYNSCKIGDQLKLSAAQLFFLGGSALSSGDTVALMRVDTGHYLVLGKVTAGESVTSES